MPYCEQGIVVLASHYGLNLFDQVLTPIRSGSCPGCWAVFVSHTRKVGSADKVCKHIRSLQSYIHIAVVSHLYDLASLL